MTRRTVDPSYELKGAARVAQTYYYPADYVHAVEPVNVLATYEGRLWEHAEGQQLLHAKLEYGLALYGRHRSIHGDDPPGQLRPLICPAVSAAMLLGPRSDAPHLLGS